MREIYLMYTGSTLPAPIAFLALLTCVALLGGCSGSVSHPKAVGQYVDGALAARQGQADQAIPTLEGAIQRNPDLLMARVVLGDLYYTRGQIQQAAEQYLVLTRLDPYDSKNHYKLGVSYEVLQRFQEAAASYLRALDWNPRMPRVR